MERFTLNGIGLSLAALTLGALAALERPAAAQQSPSGPGPNSVEGRVKSAEGSLASAQARLNRAEDVYKKMQPKVEELQAVLHALTSRAETSRASLSKAASHLDEEADALSLEQAGADARQKALEVAIQQQAKRAEGAVQADEVAAELQKVVEARTTQVKRMEQLQATGAVPNTDVDGAMAALAEARARLAERRQHTAAAAGGAALADLNRELLNLSVANAERHAKLKFLEERRQGLAEALRRADELERYKQEMDRADRDRRSARQEAENWEERLTTLKSTPTTQPRRD